MAAGRLELEISDGEFSLGKHMDFLERERDPIAAFRALQTAAFNRERAAWAAAGEFDPRPEPAAVSGVVDAIEIPDGATLVESPLGASVWKVDVEIGDAVRAGDRLLTLEAMKTETAIDAPYDGEVLDVLVSAGTQVDAGTALVVLGAKVAV
jgi:urea carboxylase